MNVAVNLLAATLPRGGTGGPPSATDAAAGGDSFARLLDREQAAPAAPAEPPRDAAAGEGPQAVDRQTGPRSARPAKPAGRTPEKAATPPAPTREEPETRADDPPEETASAPAAGDPALLHWVQGLKLPAAPAGAAPGGARERPAAPGEGVDVAGDTPCAGAPAANAPHAAGRGASRTAGTQAATTGPAIERDTPAATRTDARADPPADTPTPRAEGSPPPRFADVLGLARGTAPDAPGATAGAAPAAPGTPVEAPPPAAAAVAVPFDDPQFPRAFGVQVSVLAREGVQQAELHLNPAEMGPVSVQIVMEGTQARIDFGADAAPTRSMIEQSLPELAAALREAGLTLAGGGVSQHAGHGRDPAGQAAAPARLAGAGGPGGADATAASAQPLRRSVRAGGVDLYA